MAKIRRTSRPLGERVKQLRTEHGMTLKQVSSASGISVSTLSKLENGQTGLSLDNVILLAAAFGMPVSILLNDAGTVSGEVSVSRAAGPYDHDVDQLDFKVLHDDLPGQSNVFWRVRVKSHSLEAFGPYHAHPGEEFFYVLVGRVKLFLQGREPIILKTGDSVLFDSSLEHAYVSMGKTDAQILMSNTITHARLPGFIDLDGAPARPRRGSKTRKAGAKAT